MKNLRRPLGTGGMLLLSTALPVLLSADQPPAAAAKARISENYGKLPMSFEENRGQTGGGVQFLSQGQGYSLFLTSRGAVLSLRSQLSPTKPGKHAVVRMEFSGAHPAAVTGEDRQAARSSYFVGNDPAQWVVDAPNYARVRYRALYPGVDLVFYGNQRQLEYDLVVAPGADPGAIRLKFDGLDGLRLDRDGDLLLRTGAGEIRQHRPILYQERGGVRQPVEGRYVLQSHGRVAFRVARYDRRRPLIIDPALSFATYLGTSGFEQFDPLTGTFPAVAVDFLGYAYVTGFNGGSAANFPGNPTVLGPGGTEVFVVKLNATGTALLYSVVLGGGMMDVGGGIAVDASGNAYITGFTSSSNFPVSGGAPQNSIHSMQNAFVTEINAAGNGLLYSTFLGGTGNDWGRGIAVDNAGNAYVTGAADESAGTNFPLVNALSSTPAAGFLAEVNSAGTAFVYSTFLSAGIGYGVAVDSTGSAYVAGTTGTPNAYAQEQAYVLKVNPAGAGISYGPVLFGNAADQSIGFAIALDSQNNAYVTGMTDDPAFPVTMGAAQTAYGGGSSDGFALKLDTAGELPPVYATYIGGLGSNIYPERGTGIGVDVDGYAYVAGTTQCIRFPSANPISGAQHGGPAVLLRSTNTGSSWSPVSLAGNFDQVTALAIDLSGNIYAGTSTSNPPSSGGVYGGVYKSTNSGSTWTLASSGITSTTVDALAVDPSNSLNVYAVAGGQIYLSTNGGGSWTAKAAAGAAGSIAITQAISPTIYVGSTTGTGLQYSTNTGGTWTPISSVPAPVYAVVVDQNSTNKNTVYAATNSGVYKTTNGPAGPWNFSNSGLPAGAVTGLAISSTGTVYAITEVGLYSTTNHGANWTLVNVGVEAPGTPVLVGLDSANNVYLALQGGGMMVGTNSGTTWTSIIYNGLTHNQVLALAATSSSNVFAGITSPTDVFLTRISPDGSSFSFATCIGGADNDLGQNMAVTPTGMVYISGATASSNLPTTPGALQPALAGSYDALVARVDNEPFTDVAPSNPFFNFINVMYEKGITGGCASNPPQYCPNSNTTRGEMAVFIVTAIEGGSNFTYTMTPYFTDVPPSDPFFKFIQKLKDLNITGGCTPTMYCPNDPVTRGQMAVFIITARYGTISFTYPSTPYFTDVSPSNPFFPFIQKMKQAGITGGCTPTMYCPNDSLTRGQMAVFIDTGLLNQLLAAGTPTVSSMVPNAATAGQSLTATIYGLGTHFAGGTTQVTVPTGITAGTVSVNTATSLTVQLNVDAGATLGPYSIVVTTGSEEAVLPNGFTVQ